MRFGRQFSLKHMLLLMVASAIAILVYQRFIYVHPAHRANPLYEKSPPITGGRVKIGTCELSIRTVARTDRDGTIVVEDGFGQKLNTKVDNAKVLKQSGAWLDTTQIEFDVVGGEVDVHGFRIFDHESRAIVYDLNSARGSRRVDHDTVHIYGLGNKLPDRVDVFMRARAYGPSNKVSKLEPKVGATTTTRDGVIRVDRIIRGMSGYSIEDGFKTTPSLVNDNTFVLLAFDGDQWSNDAKYEITVVTKRGQRARRDRYFRAPGDYLMPDGSRRAGVRLSWNLDEIAHLEVRPLGEYLTFFFDGLQIPKTSNAKFQPPPNPVIQVNGQEKEFLVKELAPLDVSFRFMRGDAVDGTRFLTDGSVYSLRQEPNNPDTEMTMVGRAHGISKIGWDLLLTPNAFKYGTQESSGSGRWTGAFNYRVPLEDVKQLQIQMPAP